MRISDWSSDVCSSDLGVSMLTRKWALRLSLGGTAAFTFMLALVPFIGQAANGAHRWIGFGGFLLQPSEFLKPLFIVSTAWLLALGQEDRTLPTMKIYAVLLLLVMVLLVQQPRSEERRGGKECVSTGRSRLSPAT